MTKKRYVVFDVETPNRYNNRMSAIGISVVEDGRIVDEFFTLVDPEQPFDRFSAQLSWMLRINMYQASGHMSSMRRSVARSFTQLTSKPIIDLCSAAFQGANLSRQP